MLLLFLFQALFLVGMGLNEQIKNKNFDFVGCAEKANIFEMMKSLVGKPEAEPHGDLLGYMLEVVYCYFCVRQSNELTGWW